MIRHEIRKEGLEATLKELCGLFGFAQVKSVLFGLDEEHEHGCSCSKCPKYCCLEASCTTSVSYDPHRRRMIDSFQGGYRYLSNFHLVDVELDGVVYTSTEAAYQAAKTLDKERRKDFEKASPRDAKRMGRALALRPDWEQVKIEVMEKLLRQKFAKGTQLAQALIATENEELIEGNTWKDTFWGVCNGVGTNYLGKLLMKIRSELRGETERLGYCD